MQSLCAIRSRWDTGTPPLQGRGQASLRRAGGGTLSLLFLLISLLLPTLARADSGHPVKLVVWGYQPDETNKADLAARVSAFEQRHPDIHISLLSMGAGGGILGSTGGGQSTGPDDSLLVPVVYLFNNAFQYFKMGYASALAWLLFILILILGLTLGQLKLAPR